MIDATVAPKVGFISPFGTTSCNVNHSSARRRPLARSVPQKTLGALPWPIVANVQIAWLPHGSNFSRAHGRGVAPVGHAVAGHMV